MNVGQPHAFLKTMGEFIALSLSRHFARLLPQTMIFLVDFSIT